MISGTITQAGQPSAPTGQYQVRYQDIVITDQNGYEWQGRIGSKQGYQVNTPIAVTVEEKMQDGVPYNYFRKHNPQYSQQTPQRGRQAPPQGQQAPSQAVGAVKPSKEVDWDAKDLRMARMSGLNNATQLICLLAEMTKNDDSLNINHVKGVAAEYVDYIYNGLSRQLTPNTNPDYSDNPAQPEDDVPF